MGNLPRTCRTCGAPLRPEAHVCPTCGSPVVRVEGDARHPAADVSPRRPEEDTHHPGRPTENPFATELQRRLARLAQWAEAAEPLGVELPRLPLWAEEAAVRARNPEPWADVVRGVERLAQRRIAEAFDRWEERTTVRIGRLEAYSVDSRLEHSQVEDAVHAAKAGDLAQALATFQQVDRVVALKEHHLDQARGDLEHLLAFLKDLEALGLVAQGEPQVVGGDLERELRTGRLASLKQRLRQLRSRAAGQVSESLAEYIGRFGEELAGDRGPRTAGDENARELAVATRAIVLGHVEDGVRRLRALKEARGLSPVGAPTEAGEVRSG